jgi:hypothetical protein
MTKTARQKELYWRLSLWLPKEWREQVHATAESEKTTINAIARELLAQRFGFKERVKE